MEPTLLDREVILFDKENLDVSKGGIFIVSTNAGLFVKRVALKVDGSLELISDNKSYNSELPVLKVPLLFAIGIVLLRLLKLMV